MDYWMKKWRRNFRLGERMKPYLILAGIMLAALGNAQAETFRWVDKAGKVHYGDMPSEEAVQVEQKNFGKDSSANNADLPYETRNAMKNFPVTLYVANNCDAPCQQARDLLNNRGIPFSEKTLLTQQEIDDFRQRSGSDRSPTLQVGGNYLKGLETTQWNNALDSAGYPKTAPYRPQAAKPAKASPEETPPQ